ncbi:MAG: cell division protein FtsZ [Paludibacteraceae bacterium]|nr:cell division protein FtsZ [Paludibacteraceae bacterium]
MEDESLLPIQLEFAQDSIIKVMGVGGGGGNAINYMYRQGVEGVTYLICNTDRQVLSSSPIHSKLQLGPGLGAGGEPEKARKYAEENRDRIKEALDDGTKMLFIAAGMGGGTGTGASPVIAEVAREMNILTVGIVTIPFAFEGYEQIEKAMKGVAELSNHVDAIIVISNEKLTEIYPDMDIKTAFAKADDVISNAAKSIAEIITIEGYVNTDFADVYNTLKGGHVAIMNVGRASGENRITNAIRNALESPLVNSNDVHGANRILIQLYCSEEHAVKMAEFKQLNAFKKEVGQAVAVRWGATYDNTLGEELRLTLIATGYTISDIPTTEDTDNPNRPTITQAIEKNYTEEEERKKREEEERRKAEQEAQLKAQEEARLKAQEEARKKAQEEAQKHGTNDDKEIVIQFEDVPAATPSKPTPPPKPADDDTDTGGLFGWMRGRR